MSAVQEIGTQSATVNRREGCQLLGISLATWDRLHAEGKLPGAIRLGRCLRWPRDLLLAWISDGCPEPTVWERRRGR